MKQLQIHSCKNFCALAYYFISRRTFVPPIGQPQAIGQLPTRKGAWDILNPLAHADQLEA